MTKPPKRRWRWWVLASLALILAAVALAYATRPGVPSQTLPNPNGFDWFAQAGAKVRGDVRRPIDADADSLRAFLAANAEPLREFRQGHNFPSRVPLGPDQAESFNRNSQALGLTRKLGRLGLASGRLAEWEGRDRNAIRDYYEVIRMGYAAVFGGLLSDQYEGRAIRQPAFLALDRMRNRLGRQECRDLLHLLKAVESFVDSPAQVIARDRRWFLETNPWQVRTSYQFLPSVRRSLDSLALPGYRKFELTTEAELADIRRQRILIAARLFQLEQSSPPTRLADLVPRYLDRVPNDPASGAPFRLPSESGDGPTVQEPEVSPTETPDTPADPVKG